MRRIAIGVTTGLAIWFGSALAAEAQQITPTGPLSVTAGATSSTYTATITIPTPMTFAVRLWVYKNGVLEHFSNIYVPNPGTTTYYYSKFVDMSTWGLVAGDSLNYVAKLSYNKVVTNAPDWPITVQGTRPSSKPSYRKAAGLTLQSIERDRRRE